MSNPTNLRERLDAVVEDRTPAAFEAKDAASDRQSRAVNDNTPTPPIVVLHPTGDGALLYRALARVLVRRELIFANAIPTEGDCEIDNRAG